ncbi:hypothetical protein A500_18962 [Clostridium sartagoforme AAU1]|uniref:DUF58 domain-containing protein n=1 Tax=Clostridium sartagoforme AAU1 TaxID=1202534 RepID=R9BYJ9_9CLOT|nr:DUF58 domain-containing protein [Clostridium sartagoforme]EOR20046.1 hypothetical protein A500_18962 [Clostridium sartagoforme AAU1]
MKLNRILYLSLLIITFTFVYYYGGKVPNMFFYTVLVLPIVSFTYMLIGYFMLKYEQSLDNDLIFKGDKVTFTVNITNRSFFILPYISISFLNDKGGVIQKHKINNISLQPFSKREVSIDYIYKYRGDFKLGVSTIEVQDFLGIFKFTLKNKTPLYITVYPQIIDIDEFYLSSGYLSDNVSSIGGGQEDISTIEEINKYNYGDSLRKIHWKLTAKTNELMIREYEKVGSRSAILILDLQSNNFEVEKNAAIEDKLLETTIAILRYCIYNDAEVKLIYDSKGINAINYSNSLDFQKAYETLAKIEFNQKTSFKDIIESEVNCNIGKADIIIATFNINYILYEELNKAILLGCNITLIYIYGNEKIENNKAEDKENLSKVHEDNEAKTILVLLSELGIKLYAINIEEDIQAVFKQGGKRN